MRLVVVGCQHVMKEPLGGGVAHQAHELLGARVVVALGPCAASLSPDVGAPHLPDVEPLAVPSSQRAEIDGEPSGVTRRQRVVLGPRRRPQAGTSCSGPVPRSRARRGARRSRRARGQGGRRGPRSAWWLARRAGVRSAPRRRAACRSGGSARGPPRAPALPGGTELRADRARRRQPRSRGWRTCTPGSPRTPRAPAPRGRDSALSSCGRPRGPAASRPSASFRAAGEPLAWRFSLACSRAWREAWRGPVS